MRKYLELISLSSLLSFFLYRSWRKWPDPFVDFGREAYTAWQIAEGKLYGKDIAPLFGPLSGHINGALFGIFGKSLSVLFSFNFLVFIGIFLLNQVFLRKFASRFAVYISTIVFISLFGFSQLHQVGSYNFMAPYSHELTHGLFLALLSLVLAGNLNENSRMSQWFILGLVLGALLLTKYEMILAGFTGVFILLPRKKTLPLFAGILVMPAFFFIFYTFRTDHSIASQVLFNQFKYLTYPILSHDPFYRESMGIDYLPARVSDLTLAFSGFILFFIFAWTLNSLLPRFFLVPLFILGCWTSAYYIPWSLAPKALPLLVLCTVGLTRNRTIFAYAAFSFLLLLKIIFNARFSQYGFILAAPATVLITTLVIDFFRKFQIASSLVLAMLFGMVYYYTDISEHHLTVKNYPVGENLNKIYVSSRSGEFMAETLKMIQKTIAPSETLAVIPEGSLLNFLSERKTSVPYLNFLPLEFELFGKEAVTDSLKQNPPDYLLTWAAHALGKGLGTGSASLNLVSDQYVEVNYYEASKKIPGWISATLFSTFP